MLEQTGQITILRQGKTAIHSYMAPVAGDMVCSHVIETESRTIVVDAQLLRPYASELRRYVDRLGKPIDRVIITHQHPDHWLGLESFEDVPIHAFQEVRDTLTYGGEMMRSFRKQAAGEQGHLVADKVVPTTHTLEEGSIVIDGLELVVKRLVNAESPSMAIVEIPELGTLIAQDLAYNGVHPAVGEKGTDGAYLFDGWLAAIDEAQKRDYTWILPGHGEPCGPEVLPKVAEYVTFARDLHASGVKPDEFKARLLERYPNLRVPELVDMSVVFLYFRTW